VPVVHDQFVVFSVSRDRDPDGSRLRRSIEAQFALDRARARREFFVYLLAALSVPVWLSAAWPHWVSPDLRAVALAAWVLCLLALLTTVGSEWGWFRRRAALIDQVGPATPAGLGAPDPADGTEFSR
jgi:hypothetical protein